MLPGSGHILNHWPQGTPLGTLIPKPAQDNKGLWRASTPAPPQRKGHTLGGHCHLQGVPSRAKKAQRRGRGCDLYEECVICDLEFSNLSLKAK